MNKTLLSWILVAQSVAMSSANADTWNPSHTWLKTPWEIRYLLFIGSVTSRAEDFRLAKRNNAADGRNGKQYVYLDVDELLKINNIFATPSARAIAISALFFDQKGNVVTNERALRGFSGRFSTLDHLLLIRKDAPSAKPYHLLHWSQGIPGNLTVGPSPCTLLDQRRYEDGWKSGSYPGDFGCREWTAQLFDNERPYIDVTTYTDQGNFIGEFVGWSRFMDKPKPVIGMNGKTWLCLHECPAGERPGIIADITAWTRKHSYPVPIRPAYQPEFPNRNYQDDID